MARPSKPVLLGLECGWVEVGALDMCWRGGGIERGCLGEVTLLSRVKHYCRFDVNYFFRFTSSAWARCWAASVR